MLSSVISNSCALYRYYGNYGPPPYPRKNIRPRASLQHSQYNPYRPYLRRVDTRVSLADPKKISRATSRGQYVTMPVCHPRLHFSPRLALVSPRLVLGAAPVMIQAPGLRKALVNLIKGRKHRTRPHLLLQ